MTPYLRMALSMLALCLAGCVPFVLEGQTRHFAASEYSYPLADGHYVVEGQGKSSVKLVARADHLAATVVEDGRETMTLIGGFIALGTSGHFIFQATDATENGKAVSKAPDETTYLPIRVKNSDEATWFAGPDRCDAECSRLLLDHGFHLEGGDWRAPKGLSKVQLMAFYEALAPLLDRSGWKGTTMLRIAGL
ncbi:hypothetical protein A6A04_20730 [Paramagnetospirillum marisnigri]|uniref:Lipoprotein n=1 Tax=Paramagnetospirillum marisnigri TaxID=1285242 RepID=A0A178MC40_9PROT|nr:hypothetical protein [Paramagnetospirillum marisnigri]OAN46096.1 hypothetical protein A6A04_20730 [Paramagnetospirillum marisnigri]